MGLEPIARSRRPPHQDQALLTDPWQHVIPFERVVRGELGSVQDQIHDQICLVGVDTGVDEQRVWSSGGPARVAGVKLHADAITTLLSGIALRRVPPLLQLLLMLVLAALAAWSRVVISPERRGARAAFLVALIAADLGLSLVCVIYLNLFMDASYHVLAIALTYWYAERLQGRFFARAPREQGGVA